MSEPDQLAVGRVINELVKTMNAKDKAELKKILEECSEIVYATQKWVHARNRINELIEK